MKQGCQNAGAVTREQQTLAYAQRKLSRKPPRAGLVNSDCPRKNGRGERIRTSDPLVPNQVLYQAEPLPDRPACFGWDARRHRPGRDGRSLERTAVSVAEQTPPAVARHDSRDAAHRSDRRAPAQAEHQTALSRPAVLPAIRPILARLTALIIGRFGRSSWLAWNRRWCSRWMLH